MEHLIDIFSKFYTVELIIVYKLVSIQVIVSSL